MMGHLSMGEVQVAKNHSLVKNYLVFFQAFSGDLNFTQV